jgi:hypothetical protein
MLQVAGSGMQGLVSLPGRARRSGEWKLPMKRNSLFLAVVFAFSITAAWAQSAQSVLKANPKVVSPFVHYDDFNGLRIDPAK